MDGLRTTVVDLAGAEIEIPPQIAAEDKQFYLDCLTQSLQRFIAAAEKPIPPTA
jgi:hypothetical protein